VSLKVVAIEVVSHLVCAAIMYYVARCRWGSNAWWWLVIGVITGPIGFIFFWAFVGWQVMFQKGAEQRTLTRSERLLKSQREDQLLARQAIQDPDRDWQLDQLLYEGKMAEALDSARERLRVAHEMGDTATEQKMRQYIEKLSSK